MVTQSGVRFLHIRHCKVYKSPPTQANSRIHPYLWWFMHVEFRDKSSCFLEMPESAYFSLTKFKFLKLSPDTFQGQAPNCFSYLVLSYPLGILKPDVDFQWSLSLLCVFTDTVPSGRASSTLLSKCPSLPLSLAFRAGLSSPGSLSALLGKAKSGVISYTKSPTSLPEPLRLDLSTGISCLHA